MSSAFGNKTLFKTRDSLNAGMRWQFSTNLMCALNGGIN